MLKPGTLVRAVRDFDELADFPKKGATAIVVGQATGQTQPCYELLYLPGGERVPWWVGWFYGHKGLRDRRERVVWRPVKHP